jgi:hypothetical protein
VSAIALQRDGRVLIGGQFSAVNGFPSSFAARLNGDLLVLRNASVGPPPRAFGLLLSGPVGATSILQAANDLRETTWTSIATNTLQAEATTVLDTSSTGHVQRFYRALLQ